MRDSPYLSRIFSVVEIFRFFSLYVKSVNCVVREHCGIIFCAPFLQRLFKVVTVKVDGLECFQAHGVMRN